MIHHSHPPSPAPHVARGAALRTFVNLFLFGAVPLVSLAFALVAFSSDDRLALDFHHEVYPQAERVRAGEHAYTDPAADLSDGTNLIWPIAAVLPIVPLTTVGPEAADWIATWFTIGTFVAALVVLGVRDWRVYGVTLLWPSVIDAYQTANASLPLLLLVAVALRWRKRAVVAGVAIGAAVAVKFFLWPLMVWLLATRRYVGAAIAAMTVGASILLMVPFTDIGEYVQLLQQLRRTFEHESYTLFALLQGVGISEVVSRGVMLSTGLVLLGLAWRTRDVTLAIAAALALSPIVWRHFFVLLIVPLALTRPRLTPLWFVPLGMWLGVGTFNGAWWQTATVLGLSAIVVVACARDRQPRIVPRAGSAEPAFEPMVETR